MKRFLLFLTPAFMVLLTTVSCTQPGGKPATIGVTPKTALVTAGGAAVPFKATLSEVAADVSWTLEPDLGTLSSDTGLETSYTPPATVPAPTTVTLTASLGKLSAHATITVSKLQTSVYADPVTGLDSNDGTEDAPVRTVRHALALAVGGKTVYLAGGTYDQTSGETYVDETDGKFGYVIPDGVQITPDPRTSTPVILKNTAGDAYALRFEGSGRISDMQLEDFREAISATTGTQGLYGIAMRGIGEHGIALKGTANLTCSSCAISVDEYYALYLDGSAKIKLDGTSTVNLESPSSEPFISVIYIGVGSNAQAELDLGGGTTIGGYQVFGGALTLNEVDLRLRNVYGDAIQVAADAALDMTDGRVTGGWFSSGGSNEQALVSYGTLSINGTVFDGNLGGAIELQGGTATIQNAKFQNIGDPNTVYAGFGLNAITVYKATKLTMRTTAITNIKAAFNASTPIPGESGVGVYVADASAGIDLGTQYDLGRNLLSDCGAWCLQVSGQGSGAGTVQAVGNTWNANVQGADSSGKYAAQSVSPASYTYGDNYYVNYPNVLQF